MAAAKSTTPGPEPTPDATNAAIVQPQEYAAGVGWEVGQTAPSDAFRALDGEGYNTPSGPVVYSHPGGHARQIVARGGLITEGVARELAAGAADEQSGEG